MTKTELIELMNELGLRPSRKLGQNFLVDGNLLRALVRAADPRDGEEILEIGPGTGILTRHLLDAGARVTAVEIDGRLAEYLERELGTHPAFRLIRADACRMDCAALFDGRPYRCIANLPYSAGTVFIARMAEADHPPRELYVLLQKEVAERLVAAPGSKIYGSLTVVVGLRFEADIVRIVPPGVFFPPPEVDSAYVRLRLRDPGLAPDGAVRELAASLAKQAFGQRRKMAARVLARSHPGTDIEAAFARAGIAADARPERIAISDFVQLASCVRPRTDHIDETQQGG